MRGWTLPREGTLLELSPQKRKFCDFYHIKTRKYHDISHLEKQHLAHFLQTNYISSESVLHMISANALDHLMTGFIRSPAISIYFDYDYTSLTPNDDIVPFDMSTNPLEQALLKLQQIRRTPRIQACMLSTQINLYNPTSITPSLIIPTPLYYWNYICTKRTANDPKYTQHLIQTHDYNIRMLDNRGTLFKKEIILCEGVVPLIQYRSYSYIIAPRFQLRPLSLFLTIQQLRTESDISIIINCLTTSGKKYILPEIGNIPALLNNHELFVFSLKYRDEIYGMYFVKNANMHYDGIEGGDIGTESGNSIQLIASVKQVYSDELFVLGWEHVLHAILKIRNTYRILLVDEMADNAVILGSLNRSLAFQSNMAAYYLYNYAMYGMPFRPNEWAIIV